MTGDHTDPETLRDTLPVRPLRKWLSRTVVTVAILASAALGIYAAMKMQSMASDPDADNRFEIMERMRLGETVADTVSADSSSVAPDTSTVP